MPNFDPIVQVMRDYAASLGLEGANPDEDSRLSLNFADLTVTFSCMADPVEALAIHVDLGHPNADNAAVAHTLLEFNFQTWASNAMMIGFDPEAGRALGWTAIPVEHISVPRVAEVVQNMLSAATEIRVRLDQPQSVLIKDPVSPSAGMPV